MSISVGHFPHKHSAWKSKGKQANKLVACCYCIAIIADCELWVVVVGHDTQTLTLAIQHEIRKVKFCIGHSVGFGAFDKTNFQGTFGSIL